MSRAPIKRFAAAALMATALAAVAVTTTSAQPQQQDRNGFVPPNEQYKSKYVIDLDFKGGTLREYVNAIQKKAASTNVLIDPLAERFPVPSVQFRSVDVASAMELLDHRAGEVDGRGVRIDVRTIDPPNTLSEPVYAVHAETFSPRKLRDELTMVISVKDLLDADYTADDILTAVETALNLVDDGVTAQVRFHKETGLLIARGPEEQVSAVVDVTAQLRQAAHEQLDQKRQSDDSARQHREMTELRSQIEDLQRERQVAIEQLTEARTRAELLQQELENARARLNERDHEAVTLQSRLRALQIELQEVHQQLEKRESNP